MGAIGPRSRRWCALVPRTRGLCCTSGSFDGSSNGARVIVLTLGNAASCAASGGRPPRSNHEE